jgi:hypothetical protein
LGRFLQRDPKEAGDDLNPYTYAANSPIAFMDQLGQEKTHAPGLAREALSVVGDARGELGSLQGLDVALRDLYKEANVGAASVSRDMIQRLGQSGGDVSGAGAVARSVSDLRNLLRAATQDRLTPVGRMLSRIFEKDRSWTQIVEKYGNPFDASLSAEQRLAIADDIAAASARSSPKMNALQVFGKGLLVLNSFTSGLQIGTGLDEMFHDRVGEGAVDSAEGSANLGLTIGSYAAVKSGALVAEAGTGAAAVTLLAGVAAGGSITLLASTARAAVRGEETPIEIADKYYGTSFSDIYSWQKRSVAARITFGVLSLGMSEGWYALNKSVE